MSGPCTDCGGPDYQTLLARIAALEGEREGFLLDLERLSDEREQAEAALAERDAELHEALRVVYEEGWPGTENEHPWPLNDPEHLEAPEYERAMTPDEFLADLRARAEEGSET